MGQDDDERPDGGERRPIEERWRIDWAGLKPAQTAPRPSQGLLPPMPGSQTRVPWPLAAAIAALIAAAVVATILLRDDDAPRRATPPAAVARVQTHPERAPFVAEGVRFNAAANPKTGWVAEAEKTPPGENLRWFFVSIDYRRVGSTTAAATPSTYGFRLQDAEQNTYPPDAQVGDRGLPGGAGAGLKLDQRVHGRLAFRVPETAKGLSLRFDPAPGRGARVTFAGS